MGTNFWNADATAANNTTLGGTGIEGSDNVANFDNALREQHAQTKRFALDLGGTGTVGGTADALTLTSNQTITAYVDGMLLAAIAGSDNATTTPTLNVDGVGAKVIKKCLAADGAETALAAGDIQSGGLYLFRYRSAWASAAGAWQLVNLNEPASPAVSSGSEIQKGDGSGGLEAAVPDTDFVDVDGSLVSFGDLDIVAGDIIYGSGTDTVSRLAAGDDGQVLTLASGVPSWADAAAGGSPNALTQQTSSEAAISFTIPAGANRVILAGSATADSVTPEIIFKLGDSGGIETTGYSSHATRFVDSSDTFQIDSFTDSFNFYQTEGKFVIVFEHMGNNLWAVYGVLVNSGSELSIVGGYKTLSGELTTVQVSAASGFNAATIDCTWY